MFRPRAIRNDYAGLAELIELCASKGHPAEAWPFIDANLQSEPFSIRELAENAGLSLADFQAGFDNVDLYRRFRSGFSVEDHCVALYSRGLCPNRAIVEALTLALLAPFGLAARLFREHLDRNSPNVPQAGFDNVLKRIADLLPLFGANWLAVRKPPTRDEQIKLLSLGILFLPDIVVAETARQIGFLAGQLGFPDLDLDKLQKPKNPIGKSSMPILAQSYWTEWRLIGN